MPNLKTLEFSNVEFNFPNNIELRNFINNEKYMYSLLSITNISKINMSTINLSSHTL